MNKIKFRRFIARNLNGLVEKIYQLRFNLLQFEKPPVIILTPGKVGSSSVYKTLRKTIDNSVFHIHCFSETRINRSISIHISSHRKSRPLHLIVSELLRKKLKNYSGDKYIITIVREPVSRAVSAFFQNTELYRKDIEKEGLEIDEIKAKKLLMNNLSNGVTHELEEWFGDEINDNFGIDVFEKPFDIKKGYMINRKDKIHHLILKMENLNETFPNAIQEFLKLSEPLNLQNANIGEQKHYAQSYKRIKNDIKLSPDRIDKIISSKYFQQFYKDQESFVKQKWQKN